MALDNNLSVLHADTETIVSAFPLHDADGGLLGSYGRMSRHLLHIPFPHIKGSHHHRVYLACQLVSHRPLTVEPRQPLGFQGFQEFYLHDAQLTLGSPTVLRLEEVQFASSRLSHLNNASEGILVLTGTLQPDGYLVGLYRLGGFQVYIAQAPLRLTAPYQRLASKYL